MVRVKIVVRELGSGKPEYSLQFDLPELPRVGDYVSIQRLEHRSERGDDLIVRHVWWRLRHSEMPGVEGEVVSGSIREVIVECDPAIGPWSSDRWMESVKFAGEQRNVNVEKFDIRRLNIRERDLPR